VVVAGVAGLEGSIGLSMTATDGFGAKGDTAEEGVAGDEEGLAGE
jgi:hypothetical protein